MYYKKHKEIPGIPDEIKQECINLGTQWVGLNYSFQHWYSRYEYDDISSIAYIEKGSEKEHFNQEKTGGVGFYNLPEEIVSFLVKYYSQIDHPIKHHNDYYLQAVTGSTYVAPHIDDPKARVEGFFYLIKSGGPNVSTAWYEIKEQYLNLRITPNTSIPYSKINKIESHCLEEDTWHWLNFSKIHSVENQQSLRLALYGYTNTTHK